MYVFHLQRCIKKDNFLKRLGKMLICFLLLTLTSTVMPVHAAQILPTTNNAGSTINVTVSDENNTTFKNYGTINISSGGTLTNSGTMSNDGQVTNSGTLTNSGTIDNTSMLTSDGIMTNTGTLNNSYRLYNYSGGTLTNDGTLNNYNIVENEGTLINNAGATLYNYSGGELNNSGGTLTNYGTINNYDWMSNSGTLNNYGTLNAAWLSNSSYGIVNNSGTLTITTTLYNYLHGTVNNTGTLNNSGTSYNWGALTNSGTLNNSSGATFTNQAGATFNNASGAVFTNNGTFNNAGTFTNSGTVKGTGTIIGNFSNDGILAPGNSIGTLTITGNYTHNTGATYQVEVNSAGQSDKLVVTGTATLKGGTVFVLAGLGVYKIRTNYNYTILTAGSVVGTFANITSNLAFLTPSLSYDASDVYLTLTRNTNSFADVATTPNQYAVASALDRTSFYSQGDMDNIINNLLILSASGARNAYDQMGGISHASLTEATLFSLNRYVNTLSGRMAGFNTGGLSLADTGNILLAAGDNTGSDAGNMLVSAIRNANKEDPSAWGLWAKGYGNLGNRRGDDLSSKYDYNGGGLIAGFDRKLTEYLLLGAAAGYTYTKVNMSDLNDNGKVAGYQGSLYTAYNLDSWYINGLIAYGYNRYNTTRNISFGSIARTANADYDGQSLSGYVETGYRIKTAAVNIIPLASVQVSSLWRSAFTESNAGALDLVVDSDRTTSFIGSLGVKLRKEYKTKNGSISPEIRCKWLHEFADSDYMLNASLTGYPVSSFSVRGDRAHRDSADISAGFSWEIDRSFALAFTYDAVLTGDRTEHAGTAGIRFRW